MNELLVIKSPLSLHRDSTGFAFMADEIVGVIDGALAKTKHGYKPHSGDFEDVIQLGEGQPERIIEAYERSKVAPPELREYINCYMFVYFALGKAKSLRVHDHYPAVALNVVLPEATDAGIPYSTVTPEGNINHSFIGTGRGNEGLSVLGDHGVLASVNNHTLTSLYEANRVVEMSLETLGD